VPSSGVVGRGDELAAIDTLLGTARHGFATLALEGSAGIGKTTLWEEAVRRAKEQGACVLACRPNLAEARFSFGALTDLLSSVEDRSFEGLPAPQREALEVALLRATPTGLSPSARAVAMGLLSLVRHLAMGGLVVLAIDDAQWLDAPSRLALEFCSRRMQHETVALVYTMRLPAPDLNFGPATEPQRVVLGPLSLATISIIVADRLGQPLPRSSLVQVMKASVGNPFYALEIARLLVQDGLGHLPPAVLPLPADLRELAIARIKRLPGLSRDALLLAAVLSAPDVQSVSLDALAPAAKEGIVNVGQNGRIEFVHPLFAAAVCGAVSTAHHREAHRRAAALVSDAEQRARHLALASAEADPEVARQLDRAAGLAARRGAPEAAAELAELAVAMTPGGDGVGASLASDNEQRPTRLLRAAQFYFDAGDLGRADNLAHQVLSQDLAPPLRARSLLLLARLAARRSNFTEAVSHATEALGAAGADDRLRASIHQELQYCLFYLGDNAGTMSHSLAMLGYAKRSGDQVLLAEGLAERVICQFLGGAGLDERMLAEALALDGAKSTSPLMFRPSYVHGLLQLWTQQLDGALRTLGKVRDEAAERGDETNLPLILVHLVQACIWRGDLTGATGYAQEAAELTSVVDDPAGSAIALVVAAQVHAHQGRVEAAREEASQSLSLFERLQWTPGALLAVAVLGFTELSVGDPTRAHAVMGPATVQLFGTRLRSSLAREPGEPGVGDPSLLIFLPDEIEALVGMGELRQAEAYLAPFEQSAADLDRPWALAATARLRGALHAARGEQAPALNAFEKALAAHDRTDMPLERARTLLLAGRVYRRFKQRRRAAEALGEALGLFESIGVPLWAATTGAELARLGAPAGDVDALSETERRLAELAATGLSNREVADHAFVSVKTVEANLSRVYRKLGVRSRASLALALARSPSLHK
jgi:DNA-binding CsgD family transcriptional regulator